jgi:hypothetical protein
MVVTEIFGTAKFSGMSAIIKSTPVWFMSRHEDEETLRGRPTPAYWKK